MLNHARGPSNNTKFHHHPDSRTQFLTMWVIPNEKFLPSSWVNWLRTAAGGKCTAGCRQQRLPMRKDIYTKDYNSQETRQQAPFTIHMLLSLFFWQVLDNMKLKENGDVSDFLMTQLKEFFARLIWHLWLHAIQLLQYQQLIQFCGTLLFVL